MQMQFTQERIRNACKSGAELLTDKDLRVPAPMAVSGDLTLLVQMMTSIVAGELVVMNAPQEQGAPPPEGEPKPEEPPKPELTPVEGGKKE